MYKYLVDNIGYYCLSVSEEQVEYALKTAGFDKPNWYRQEIPEEFKSVLNTGLEYLLLAQGKCMCDEHVYNLILNNNMCQML